MNFKDQVYDQYRQVIKNKVLLLQQVLDDLFLSAKNETKSTAGDKHETALAMLQIEQENKRKQLNDALELQSTFGKMDSANTSTRIINGSLVKTNKGYFLLGVALGKVNIEGVTVMAISPQSPLGLRLTGLKQGESAVVNSIVYEVEMID